LIQIFKKVNELKLALAIVASTIDFARESVEGG